MMKQQAWTHINFDKKLISTMMSLNPDRDILFHKLCFWKANIANMSLVRIVCIGLYIDQSTVSKSVGQEAQLILCGYEVDVNLASH